MFITVGKYHVTFWTFANNAITPEKVATENVINVSVAYGKDGKCYTGSNTGAVSIWENKKLITTVQPVNSIIHAIAVKKDKVLLGGNTHVSVFDLTLTNKVKELEIPSQTRSIDAVGDAILVGTNDGSIIEFKGNDKKYLTQGHCEDELWGLDVDPTTGLVNTDRLNLISRLLLLERIIKLSSWTPALAKSSVD